MKHIDYDIAQAATLADMAMCLNHYRLSTPGLYVCIHVPVRITADTVVVPGAIAQVNYGRFKQCDPGDYSSFSGPPNFVFDVFREDQNHLYQQRRALFETSGVIEYVAWFNQEELPRWNRLIQGVFQQIPGDENGMIQSQALPGLWIPLTALAERDWWSVMAKISQGITRPGHRDFMATLWRK